MPSLVIKLANPYVAGLILAAPYGAVLSTVSGWLLIVSSGLVRDLYQRFLRPTASEREIAWASYSTTVAIGLVVAVVALNPPKYLQLIVVFSSTGMAAAFLMPALLGSFWRRTTAAGAIAAMVAGTAVTLGLYLLGTLGPERLHGSAGSSATEPRHRSRRVPSGPITCSGSTRASGACSSSLVAGLIGSLALAASRPEDRVSLLFDAQPPDAPAPATLDLHPETKVRDGVRN